MERRNGSGIVKRKYLFGALIALFICATMAPAQVTLGRFRHGRNELEQVQSCIGGQIVDFTCNHGRDNRFFSPALCTKRDMYVYLPPCYDPRKQYPLMIYMHGFSQDERSFLELVPMFDQAIREGKCPPTIVASPDGSLFGRPSFLYAGSFYVNSKAGRFEDYVMQDVWTLLHEKFSIRPEPEAHALVGGSMGGFSAYNLGIKYRAAVRNVAAVFPPLNLRYLDCHGRYFADFDPNCLSWRQEVRPKAPVARYFGGLVKIRERRFVNALFDTKRQNPIAEIARENPIEMLDTYNLRPGELEMFIGYGGRDEFNIDAQVESFIYFAKCRGHCISVMYIKSAHHTFEGGKQFFPGMIQWLGEKLAPYGPCIPAESTRR